MSTTNETTSKSWGGARKGAGRTKKYAATFYFGATEDVANILAGVDKKDRSDFINQCIIKAMGRGNLLPFSFPLPWSYFVRILRVCRSFCKLV